MTECEQAKGSSAAATPAAGTGTTDAKPAATDAKIPDKPAAAPAGTDGGVPRDKWVKSSKGDRKKKVFEAHADTFPLFDGGLVPGAPPKAASGNTAAKSSSSRANGSRNRAPICRFLKRRSAVDCIIDLVDHPAASARSARSGADRAARILRTAGRCRWFRRHRRPWARFSTQALEETSLSIELVEQFSAIQPPRAIRRHTVSTVFVATAQRTPKTADDAGRVAVFTEDNLPDMAFDHGQILADYFAYRRTGSVPARTANPTFLRKMARMALHHAA